MGAPFFIPQKEINLIDTMNEELGQNRNPSFFSSETALRAIPVRL